MTRNAKPAPIHAEHIRYGVAEVLAIRRLDSAGHVLVADVRFADGTERTIRLAPEYWRSNLAALVPTPPKKKQARQKPATVEQPLSAAEHALTGAEHPLSEAS